MMAQTPEPRFVPGVGGPYYWGMVPGLWLNEGGQSAAGAAIDHLIRSHPACDEATAGAHAAGTELLEYLERRIVSRSPNPGEAASLAPGPPVPPPVFRKPFAHSPSHSGADRR